MHRERAADLEAQLEAARFSADQDRQQYEIRVAALAAEVEAAQAAVVRVRGAFGGGWEPWAGAFCRAAGGCLPWACVCPLDQCLFSLTG